MKKVQALNFKANINIILARVSSLHVFGQHLVCILHISEGWHISCSANPSWVYHFNVQLSPIHPCQEQINFSVPCSDTLNACSSIVICVAKFHDRLCGLVVRVPGYRSRGAGFNSRRYQIFREVVGLEWGPLSLVRIIEELLEWKSSGPGLENRNLTAVGIRCTDHVTPSTHKSWHQLRREAAVARSV
jgi:hypothetical protein